MHYQYKAKDVQGTITEGPVEAASEKEASKILGSKNLFVLELNAETQSSAKKFSFRKKVNLKEKIIFTKELAMMIKGGLPLVEALTALQEQTENQTFHETIGVIVDDVKGGTALSKALTKHPKMFSKIYVAITESGEKSGKLDQVLERLADQLQKDYDLITKVKNAVTYPIVIVIALIGIMILMLVFVVPQLKQIFDEMGVQLPLPTRMLLGTSDFIIRYWYAVILVIIGVYLGTKAWAKTSGGGLFLDSFKMRVPIFGQIVKKIYLARFTRTTATLISSGLPMLEIIRTDKEVVTNRIYNQSFDQIYTDVESGVALSTALKKFPKLFPVMISQMVSTGEKSGKIDEVLFGVADFYDKEVESSTSNLASLIEPILIIIIGGGVGASIAAVILPIYSLAKTI